ncbi:hypothetical protein GCM10009565_49120 [Amycolatopsis albidoflavus]
MWAGAERPFEFESYFWPFGVVEAALRLAGLVDLGRHPVVAPESAVAEHGEEFWQDVREMPAFAIDIARKA